MKHIDPAVKFLCLLALTIVLAWKYSLSLNCAVFIGGVAAMLCCGVSLKKLALLMAPVLFAALGMFYAGYRFSAGGDLPVRREILHLGSSAVVNGLTQASRVLAFGAIGYLFALTTDRVKLVHSFRKRFRLPQVFAYGLLAAWGIFPQMLLEYRRTKAAFRARGIYAFPLSPAMLRPMLVKAVRWSEALSVAMESKGFSADAVRTEFDSMHLCRRDFAFAGLAAAICAATAILL